MSGKVNMLSEVMDALPARAVESKVTISDENWEDLRHRLCYPGGMSGLYVGQNVRAQVKCETKNGKNTRAYFCVWINRLESGYEFGTNT